jgi:flagellin-like hook-associated protein FlgL
MIGGISNLSLLSQITTALTNGQDTLGDLTQQLSSGVKATDLTRYSVYEARTIVSSRDLQNKANGYIAAIKTVEPRLTVYESSLAAIEKLIKTTQSTILNSQNGTAAIEQGVGQQIAGVIDQTAYYLNQKVGDRYIFSGTRFNQKPIGDIKALSAPPTETFPATTPTLPPYDAAAPSSDANAYAKDRVTIDDTVQLSYGISSTDSAIQNLVQGLRYAYGATQNPSTYQTNIDQAQIYLKTALDGVRALRAQVAGNAKLLADSKTSQNDTVTLLQSQLDGIRSTDINDVSVKINAYNNQLQASYAASSKLLDLSILKYLPA